MVLSHKNYWVGMWVGVDAYPIYMGGSIPRKIGITQLVNSIYNIYNYPRSIIIYVTIDIGLKGVQFRMNNVLIKLSLCLIAALFFRILSSLLMRKFHNSLKKYLTPINLP